MFNKIKHILATTTARQSMLTTISTGINGVLGAGFYFLLARFLQPTQYGLFALLIAAITMLSDICDFGGDQALVRFVPEHRTEPKKLNQIINFVLSLKIVSGLIITILLLIFANFFPSSNLMIFVGLGVLTQLLFSFSTSLAQAQESFWIWSSLFIGTNFTRIILIVLLSGLGLLNGSSSVLVYIGIPLAGFLASLTVLKFKFDPLKYADINATRVFKFNGWVSAFVVVASIGARVDTFLTGKLISLAAVGIYTLANQVVSILPQITGAIGAVTSPKFASFNTAAKNNIYTLKATALSAVVAAASCLIIIPLGMVVFKFSGIQYASAFGPMLILLLAMCIFLITSPIRDSILYYFTKPQFFFWLGLVQIGVTVGLSYYLIPRYQIIGSALTLLSGQVVIAAASLLYFWYSSSRHETR